MNFPSSFLLSHGRDELAELSAPKLSGWLVCMIKKKCLAEWGGMVLNCLSWRFLVWMLLKCVQLEWSRELEIHPASHPSLSHTHTNIHASFFLFSLSFKALFFLKSKKKMNWLPSFQWKDNCYGSHLYDHFVIFVAARKLAAKWVFWQVSPRNLHANGRKRVYAKDKPESWSRVLPWRPTANPIFTCCKETRARGADERRRASADTTGSSLTRSTLLVLFDRNVQKHCHLPVISPGGGEMKDEKAGMLGVLGRE